MTAGASRARWWLLASGLVAAALAVYGGAWGHPWLFDDTFHFAENPTVRSPSGLAAVWTSGYWEGRVAGGLYRPLLKTLWILEHALLGGGRAVVLAVSVALHAGVAWVLARLCVRSGASFAAAALAALAFALHPASSEVLLTGVGQGELASMLLALSALLVVMPGGDGAPWRLVAFVASALAATLVKEHGFPALAVSGLALALHPAFGRRPKAAALAVLGIGVAVVVAARLAVLGSFGPVGEARAAAGLGPPERLALAPALLGRYLALAAAPTSLSPDYQWLELAPPPGPATPLFWLGLSALVATGLVARHAVRRRDVPVALALLATVAALAPFLGLVPIGSLFAERHAYPFLAGTAWLAGLGATRLAVRLRAPAARRVLAGAAVAGIAILALGAAQRVPVWESGERLWGETLRVHPRSVVAASSLAAYEARRGRWAEARRLAHRALALSPGEPSASLTLGSAALREGRLDEAEARFAAAAREAGFRDNARRGLARVAAARARRATAPRPLVATRVLAQPSAP